MSSPGTPPREDPWERRERERARWNKSPAPSRPSRRTDPGTVAGGGDLLPPARPDEQGWVNNYVVVGVVIALVALLVAEVPQVGGNVREIGAMVGAGVLFLLLALNRQASTPWREVVRDPPTVAVAVLVVWSAVCFALAPFRGFAAIDMLRVAGGAGVFALCAWGLRSLRQVSFIIAALIGVGVVIGLSDILHVGGKTTEAKAHIDSIYSVFGTHEDVGSLLVLLLPVALCLSLSSGVEEKRRLLSSAATLVIGVALLLARTRSAWAGGAVGFVVLVALLVLYPLGESGAGRRRGGADWRGLIASPLPILVIAVVGFIALGGVGTLVTGRAGSLRHLMDDPSLSGRLEMWRGAVRMASEKPLAGWGLGGYPVIEGMWTHLGDEIPAVFVTGVSHENIAHNFYVQWAAETGGVGLFVYVVAVALALGGLLRALPRSRGMARAILVGVTVAAVAGSVDAIGSPCYNFHGVYAVFWALLGLGLMAGRARAGETAARPSLVSGGAALVAGAAVTALVLGVGWQIRTQAKTVGRGTFALQATPVKDIHPGTVLHFRAVFTDEQGRDRPTTPGTVWQLRGDFLAAKVLPTLTHDEKDVYSPRHGVLSVTLPAMPPGPVTMHARYCDRWGRWYDTWSTLTVGR